MVKTLNAPCNSLHKRQKKDNSHKTQLITPIKHGIDENGNWMIFFKKKDIKKLMKKFKVKKKK